MTHSAKKRDRRWAKDRDGAIKALQLARRVIEDERQRLRWEPLECVTVRRFDRAIKKINAAIGGLERKEIGP